MKELKLGTIGSGVIVHGILDNVLRTEHISLAAVYSRDREKGEQLAGQYGGRNVYTDLEAFLQDEQVNTVYIASPNILHYAQARMALQAGKHVICEKPFCIRKAQVLELLELAKKKDLMLTEAAPTTYLPNYEILKEALPKIGRIRLVMANYSQYSSRYDNLLAGQTTNVFNPQFAGGCLMDINYYNVYLTVALFGRPRTAVYYPNLHANGIDTSGIAHLQYPDFPAVCIGAKDTRGVNFYQIEGEKGYIYVEDGSNGLRAVRIVTGEKEEIVNLQQDPDRLYYEVRALTQLMLEEKKTQLYQRVELAADAVGTVEEIRKAAGLLFPGDEV